MAGYKAYQVRTPIRKDAYGALRSRLNRSLLPLQCTHECSTGAFDALSKVRHVLDGRTNPVKFMLALISTVVNEESKVAEGHGER